MRMTMTGAVIAACLAAGGCNTTLKMKPQDKLGVGGSGHILGVDVVTAEADAKSEELMDIQWGIWNPDTRGKQLVYALIAESDLRCDRYLTAVSIDRNTTRSSLDIAGLALAAIGGVASPNASANWFSAGSTLAQSSRRTLEDTVLGGREFGLIYVAVWQGREEAAKTLMKRADDDEFKTWDWRPILSLARQYDVKCGLNYGLGRLTQAISSGQGEPNDQREPS